MIYYNLKLNIIRMNVMYELEMSKYQEDRKQVKKVFINNLITSIKFKIKSGESR